MSELRVRLRHALALDVDVETEELLGLDDVEGMLGELGDGTAEREVEIENPEPTE